MEKKALVCALALLATSCGNKSDLVEVERPNGKISSETGRTRRPIPDEQSHQPITDSDHLAKTVNLCRHLTRPTDSGDAGRTVQLIR